MSVATHLQELRVRAGNPPIREIERLITRQGPERAMARSTIQDKISGKSPANLPQVLAIVEALAEHARLKGTPLLAQEIDLSLWRERVTESFKQGRPKATPAHLTQETTPTKPWNIEPLTHAHMYDLIEIMQGCEGSPTDSWLPRVIGPMLQAEMSVSSFMERAAQDGPQAVVRTLVSLHRAFPPPEDTPWDVRNPWQVTDSNQTVGVLLTHTGRYHGATYTPAIVAGMRRAEVGELVEDYLRAVAVTQRPRGLHQAVASLRVAAMEKDASTLLKKAGSEQRSDKAFKVVEHFHNHGTSEDRNRVLQGVCAEDPYSLKGMLSELKGHEMSQAFTIEVLRGIPYGKHEEYAQILTRSGQAELAQVVRDAADIPPW